MTEAERIRRKKLRRKQIRRKKIIKAWIARGIVLLAAGLIVFGIFMGIKAIIVHASGKTADEAQETTEAYEVTEEHNWITEIPETIAKGFHDTYSLDLDSEDAYLLAKIAMAEAEGETLEGKAMVIMVVLNRVNSRKFGNSIAEVIYDHAVNSKGEEVYQFAPVKPGGRWYNVEPNADCWRALRMIEVEKWDQSEGALYFESEHSELGWHSQNLEYIKTVGNHNFYK